MPNDFLMWGLSGVFSVLFWLLRNRDEAQAAQIKLLFEKHDADAQALQELRVQLASRHYEKPELDVRFRAMEDVTREGFRDLGKKFDRLTDILTKHITEEERER